MVILESWMLQCFLLIVRKNLFHVSSVRCGTNDTVMREATFLLVRSLNVEVCVVLLRRVTRMWMASKGCGCLTKTRV